ncbi:YesU family protein [Nonomuraea rosea]|uniref:YesU family protein n=1 Tax=Nonomuraea rosea TaxID=638574 RepID=A0ABP6ZCV9_9ACTN
MTELYRNPLAGPEDLEGFRMEGDGAVSFPQGRMRLESLRPPSEGQAANLVLWCPQEFPADVRIEWDFWPVREPGLAIMFFHARGRNGEDVLDPGLAERTGPYEQYHHGDIDAYHVSYFRRMWESERALHTCNLRKSHGFHLVAQGADPLPGVLDARGPYAVRIEVKGPEITFSVNDLVSFRWEDDGSIGGPALAGGKMGFRQMAPLIGEYGNLRVSRH